MSVLWALLCFSAVVVAYGAVLVAYRGALRMSEANARIRELEDWHRARPFPGCAPWPPLRGDPDRAMSWSIPAGMPPEVWAIQRSLEIDNWIKMKESSDG